MLRWHRLALIVALAGMAPPAWAGSIKDFTTVTDGVKWTYLSGSGAVLTDTTNSVTTSTTGGVNHHLTISSAQGLTGAYEFIFKAESLTGKVLDEASIVVTRDTSNVPNGQVTPSDPTLLISEVPDFNTNFANITGLTTGNVATFDITTVYYKVTANVASPLNAFSTFELTARSKNAPPPTVPEPSTWALVVIAGTGLAMTRRRRPAAG